MPGHLGHAPAGDLEHTRCPYKGTAHYWSLRLGERHEKDVAWTYPEPLHDDEAVRGLLCFPDERADLEVRQDDQRD